MFRHGGVNPSAPSPATRMLPTRDKEINLQESFRSPLARAESGTGMSALPLEAEQKGDAAGVGERGQLWRTSGNRESLERGRDSSPPQSCLSCETPKILSGGGRQKGQYGPRRPAQHASLQEALLGPSPTPSPHRSLHPQHTLFPPPFPLLWVCGAAEVMTSPRSPGRRGRINQAEWAVAMACILPLPRRLGICSLCAARVPSPWGQGV